MVDGASRAELLEHVVHLRDRLALAPASEPPPKDLSVRHALGGHRLALVASSNGEALRRLTVASERLADPSCRRIQNPTGLYYFGEPLGPGGKVAFLFPGAGAEYPNMLENLKPFVASSRWLRLLERTLGRPLRAPGTPELPLFAVEWAISAVNEMFLGLLSRHGILPDMAVGHSEGEWTALLSMGCIQLESDEEILARMEVTRRVHDARAEQRGPQAASLSVVVPEPDLIGRVLKRYAGRLFLAADDCPHHALLGGFEDAVEQAAQELAKHGAICERLPRREAPHTPLYVGFARLFEDILGQGVAATFPLQIHQARAPVYSCAIAAPFPTDPDEVRRLIARHWVETIRFRETIEAMYRDGARVFVDVGPRGILAGFVDDTLQGRPHAAVAVNRAGWPAEEQVGHALALLAAHHVPFNLQEHASPRPPSEMHPAGVTSQLPFIRGIRSREAGDGAVVASCELDLTEDLFLRDHAFGGRVSSLDPELMPLAVVPFAVSLEMLAEAALVVAPHLRVVGLRDVRARQWMALDDGRLPLCLFAKERAPGQVRLEIRREGDSGSEPIVEGTVLLSRTYVPVGHTSPSKPHAAGRWRTPASDYEGPHKRTFQGPLFRSVRQLVHVGSDGAETVLKAPTGEGFFGSRGIAFVLNPVLLEGVGQSTTYWLERRFDRWVSSLPCALGELDLHRPPLRPGTEVRCLVKAQSVDGPVARAEASLVDEDGALVATIKSWTDWCVFLPPRFRAFWLSPIDTFLSTPGEGGGGTRRLESLEPSFLESMGGFWLRVLRELVLSPNERRAWHQWGDSDVERSERLMERIVAKDAIRSVLRASSGHLWGAADIDLGPQPSVPPSVTRSWGTMSVVGSREGDVFFGACKGGA